jgi:small subunit ribosomal protein S19
MVKVFTYKGKTVEELQKMDLKDFAKLVPARQRRTLTRGFTDAQKKLLKKVQSAKEGKYSKTLRTHCRGIVIIPDMIGLKILVHNGKDFMPVVVTEEMLGHYLGEMVLTRQRVQHSAPGVGATKSSAAFSVK